MSVNDAWDWPLLNYTATVVLKRPEREFWKMTPRKLNALFDVHIEVNKHSNSGKGKSSGVKKGYIDQIM